MAAYVRVESMDVEVFESAVMAVVNERGGIVIV